MEKLMDFFTIFFSALFFSAIVALFSALLVLLATRILGKFLPGFGRAYLASLLGYAYLYILWNFMLTTRMDMSQRDLLFIWWLLSGLLLQSFLFGKMLKNKDSVPLGFPKGILVMLFQILIVGVPCTFSYILSAEFPNVILFSIKPKATITPSLTPTAPVPTSIVDNYGVPMAHIPKGEFLMGSSYGKSDEFPVHAVYLDEYSVDVYEVTNASYATCVEDGQCDLPLNIQYYEDPSYADYPVVHVEWYMALAYCEWRGARLLTEAEWEKAARGGLEGAKYPWGDKDPVCREESYNGAQHGGCRGDMVSVGSFAPNGYGLFDMAGNAMEWVMDWYQDTFYEISPYDDPRGPDSGLYRVLRGGSWFTSINELLVARRYYLYPGPHNERIGDIGFRCARSP